ncbi:MAG TPA: hypothetical protein VI454_06730 [Verrucomicrobiae bacterium]|jgi:hypothetical protein
MKTLLTALAVVAALLTARAQEKIAPDQIAKIAPRLLENSSALKGIQFKIEADADKADGLKAGDVGLIVMPDKRLTAEKLEKAGKDIVPLGQLYLKGLAPVKNGKPTDNDRMHILMLEDDGKTHRIWLCLLGVRKRDGNLELVIYGSEKAPLFQSLLRKSESATDVIFDVSGEKRNDESAEITLSILGKYKTSFVVMKQEG